VDQSELADLREQKQALEERLAQLAVCWSPDESPSARGKRQCFRALRVHTWLCDDTAAGMCREGAGRQALLQRAREALGATEGTLGCEWDASSWPVRDATSDGDDSMRVQLDTA